LSVSSIKGFQQVGEASGWEFPFVPTRKAVIFVVKIERLENIGKTYHDMWEGGQNTRQTGGQVKEGWSCVN
jgi:hypothetical protein